MAEMNYYYTRYEDIFAVNPKAPTRRRMALKMQSHQGEPGEIHQEATWCAKKVLSVLNEVLGLAKSFV